MKYTENDYKGALLTLKKSIRADDIKAAQKIIKAYKEQNETSGK